VRGESVAHVRQNLDPRERDVATWEQSIGTTKCTTSSYAPGEERRAQQIDRVADDPPPVSKNERSRGHRGPVPGLPARIHGEMDGDGPRFGVMIGLVAVVVATVILVFFGIGYALGRLFL
jgi:hypothetical protein